MATKIIRLLQPIVLSAVPDAPTPSVCPTCGQALPLTDPAIQTGMYGTGLEMSVLDATATAMSDAGEALDITPPVISEVVAGTLTSSGATITWTTDLAANGRVYYKKHVDPTYTAATLAAPYVTSHSKALTGLTAETAYDFYVISATATSRTGTSAVGTFTTAAE